MNIDDIIRHFNELSLQAGRERLSEQTGFVHYNYHIEGCAQSIPILENVIFAYALLKNKSVESIQEAKDLLEKILHFQNFDEVASQGNFPIYLHEYPRCKDRLLSINLLPVFYWILQQFSQVLGSHLNERLQRAVNGLIQRSLCTAEEKALPYHYTLKLSSSLSSFGDLFSDHSLKAQSEQVLELLEIDTQNTDWYSPSSIGDILLSLQLLGRSLSDSGWPKFWEHLCNTYDSRLKTYIGPCFQQYFMKQGPEVTLYDYYMCSSTQTISNRLDENSIVHLHATLIQPHDNIFPEKTLPVKLNGSIGSKQWSLFSDDLCSLSALNHRGNKLDSLWKGILPMHCLFLNGQSLISLVAQGGNYTELIGEIESHSIQLNYELPPEVDVEHKEEKKEVVLSFTRSDDISIFVQGKKSNTFQLGEEVTIQFKETTVTTSFELVEGEGRFVGHIMPGNRPSQLGLKNGNRFNAYDWQLLLRTLTRSSHCHIRVNIIVQRA
ncbi:MAG: hypothetical protein AAGG81_03940 [Chlamydiota bacterium]